MFPKDYPKRGKNFLAAFLMVKSDSRQLQNSVNKSCFKLVIAMGRPLLLKLTEADRHALINEVGRTSNEDVKRACKAVLLLAEGHRRRQVAQVFRVHPVTIGRWLSRYRRHGLSGLCQPKQDKRGRRPKLMPEQLELLKQAALTPPRQLGKPFAEWTLRRLARYLAQQTGVSVRFHYLGLLLRHMGVLRHGKSGFHVVPELVVVWFFIAGMRYQKDPGAKAGDRVLYGGLNLRNGQLTTLSFPNASVPSFLRFLTTLLADYPHQKILLIAESDSFRKTVKVEAILKSQQGRLEIHSFSPSPVHLQDVKRRWGETNPASAMNFLFNLLEDLTGSLRKGIGALKEALAQQGSPEKLNLAAKA